MKKASQKSPSSTRDEMRPEYDRSDFGEMMRGKYAGRLTAESNVVVLEPEVAKAFPNDEAVNQALRGLIRVATAAAARVPSRTARRAKAARAE